MPTDRYVYLIPERVPIFAAITKPNSSWLIEEMQDRPTDIALVSDAITSGKNGLYFAQLVNSRDNVLSWMASMRFDHMHFTIRPVDADWNILVVAAYSLINCSNG